MLTKSITAAGTAAIMTVQRALVLAEVRRMLARKTHLTTDFIQSLNRCLVELLRAAQHL